MEEGIDDYMNNILKKILQLKEKLVQKKHSQD